jgi:snail 2
VDSELNGKLDSQVAQLPFGVGNRSPLFSSSFSSLMATNQPPMPNILLQANPITNPFLLWAQMHLQACNRLAIDTLLLQKAYSDWPSLTTSQQVSHETVVSQTMNDNLMEMKPTENSGFDASGNTFLLSDYQNNHFKDPNFLNSVTWQDFLKKMVEIEEERGSQKLTSQKVMENEEEKGKEKNNLKEHFSSCISPTSSDAVKSFSIESLNDMKNVTQISSERSHKRSPPLSISSILKVETTSFSKKRGSRDSHQMSPEHFSSSIESSFTAPPDSVRKRQSSKENNSSLPSPRPSSETSSPHSPYFHCPHCKRTYSTQSGFIKHQQQHCRANHNVEHKTNQQPSSRQKSLPEERSTSEDKQFTCQSCDKVYYSMSALKMHIRTHTLPCKCDVCGKAFSRMWLLNGHLRTHSGEKPFTCLVCDRAFADRSNLRAHMQTHSQLKRYRCPSCGKTFSRVGLLKKHIQSNSLSHHSHHRHINGDDSGSPTLMCAAKAFSTKAQRSSDMEMTEMTFQSHQDVKHEGMFCVESSDSESCQGERYNSTTSSISSLENTS